MPKPKLTLEERLLSKIFVNPETYCWEWTARLFENGYAQIKVQENGRDINKGGHVVSYELYVGPVPEGKVLDHVCRVRKCINPDHLQPVTQRVNTLRGEGPAGINARKTHCKNGHPLSGDNLILAQGKRQCRICQLARNRKWYAAHVEEQRKRMRERGY